MAARKSNPDSALATGKPAAGKKALSIEPPAVKTSVPARKGAAKAPILAKAKPAVKTKPVAKAKAGAKAEPAAKDATTTGTPSRSAAKPKAAPKKPAAKKRLAPAQTEAKAPAKPAVTGKARGGLSRKLVRTLESESGARLSEAGPRLEVEASKFEVGPRDEVRAEAGPPPAPRQLDDFYEETNVTLLVRDPHWVFVYWEIDSATRRRFLIPRKGHSGRLLLRWYDVTDIGDHDVAAAHRILDAEINDVATSWYQYLPEANRSWCAELGVLSAESKFLAICRSNVVRTPRASLAPTRGRERWMHVSPTGRVVSVIETPGGMAPDEALLYANGGDEELDAEGRPRPKRGRRGRGPYHRAVGEGAVRVSVSRFPHPISSGEFYEVVTQEREELAERLARELAEKGKGPSSGSRS